MGPDFTNTAPVGPSPQQQLTAKIKVKWQEIKAWEPPTAHCDWCCHLDCSCGHYEEIGRKATLWSELRALLDQL